NDGFSDVPDLKSIFIHPRLFFQPNSNNTITVGYNTNYENRTGGDMLVLHHTKDSQHEFFIRHKSLRNTVDAEWENRLDESDKLLIRGTASWFDRNVESNVFGMDAAQFSWFSELSYIKRLKKNNLVAGLNLSGESFQKKEPDSTLIQNYNYTTLGVFLQDDWTIYPKLTIQ